MNNEPDDLFRSLIGKRVKAVLRNGFGLVGTLAAVAKNEILLELDTGSRLVLMKHAIEYVEPLSGEVACRRTKNSKWSKTPTS